MLAPPHKIAALTGLRFTFEAVVRRVQIGLELARAAVGRRGDGVLESLVGNAELAGAASRARAVHVAEHVDPAADVAVVGANAAADRHAPVARVGHHDHLALGARRRERLRVADLSRIYTRTIVVTARTRQWRTTPAPATSTSKVISISGKKPQIFIVWFSFSDFPNFCDQ